MIYVVTGPPAAGKTTWARQRAQPGDIVIDYDEIVSSLSPNALPRDPTQQPAHISAVARAARNAAIEAALERGDRCNVYIVAARPDRSSLMRFKNRGAEVVVIDPGYNECLRRARLTRSPHQQKMVRDWYARKRSPTVEVVSP